MDALESVKEFKSPKHKLISFFRRSRNNWKEKYQEAVGRIKLANNQVRSVEKSRAMWRERAEHWEKIAEDARLKLTRNEVEIAALKKTIKL